MWKRRWWIALATLFILVWWLVPPLLYLHTGTSKDAKLKAITDTRTALLAGLIGVGALLTFWLNSRVYRITPWWRSCAPCTGGCSAARHPTT